MGGWGLGRWMLIGLGIFETWGGEKRDAPNRSVVDGMIHRCCRGSGRWLDMLDRLDVGPRETWQMGCGPWDA